MTAHRFAVLALAGVLSLAASAATQTWTAGGATRNWSDSGNWAGGIIPSNGDDLVFPTGTASVNDLGNTSYVSLAFNGFTGCITGGGFTLTAATPITTTAAGGCVSVALNFSAPTATLSNAGTLQLRGKVSGGAITQSGAGTLQLSSGMNDYTGPTQVAGGTLSLSARDVIPDPTDLTVAGGTSLAMPSRDVLRNISLGGTWKLSVRGTTAGLYGQLLGTGTISLGGVLQVTPTVTVPPGTVLTIVDNQMGGSVGGTFSGLPEGAIFDAGSNRFQISYRAGLGGNDVTLTALSQGPASNVQDMWWVGASENGWGMSIIQHDDKLFSVIYVYDAAGKPTWFVMPAGTWNGSHTSYTGTLYLTHSSPFFAYDAGQFNPGQGIGHATITFTDTDNATLDYLINDSPGSKAITRQLFGPPAEFTGIDRGDMWWGGTNQNGWGIAILRQYATYFMVWFTYDGSGAPLWYVMPSVSMAADGTLSGPIYRTTGSPWLGHPYDPSQLQVFNVGSFTLQFNGDQGFFNYSADGHTGTLVLDRQLF